MKSTFIFWVAMCSSGTLGCEMAHGRVPTTICIKSGARSAAALTGDDFTITQPDLDDVLTLLNFGVKSRLIAPQICFSPLHIWSPWCDDAVGTGRLRRLGPNQYAGTSLGFLLLDVNPSFAAWLGKVGVPLEIVIPVPVFNVDSGEYFVQSVDVMTRALDVKRVWVGIGANELVATANMTANVTLFPHGILAPSSDVDFTRIDVRLPLILQDGRMIVKDPFVDFSSDISCGVFNWCKGIVRAALNSQDLGKKVAESVQPVLDEYRDKLPAVMEAVLALKGGPRGRKVDASSLRVVDGAIHGTYAAVR